MAIKPVIIGTGNGLRKHANLLLGNVIATAVIYILSLFYTYEKIFTT